MLARIGRSAVCQTSAGLLHALQALAHGSQRWEAASLRGISSSSVLERGGKNWKRKTSAKGPDDMYAARRCPFPTPPACARLEASPQVDDLADTVGTRARTRRPRFTRLATRPPRKCHELPCVRSTVSARELCLRRLVGFGRGLQEAAGEFQW
jgi:hypothetical protein